MLDGLDVAFTRGGYTLIAGPTGSGKSTLALAAIGVLFDATNAYGHGDVLIDGKDVFAMSDAERSRTVAAVWQRPSVQLFRGSVLDEVRAPLDYRLVAADEATRRARETLRLVGLGSIDEGRDPASLSGGEQQRLALAAALAQQSPVLVLDEATSALDGEAARRFGEALDRARAEREVTIIAVDHRPDVHLGRADRMIVLQRGRIALDDTPDRVYADREAVRRLGLRMPGHAVASGPPRVGASLQHPAAASGAALRLSGVDVAVRHTRLLQGIELSLPPGAVALLTGDNGAGKSTLLRLLAGELRPAVGAVVPKLRTRRRAGIGYAPQRGADLMLTTRVLDEACSALAHGGRGDDEATRRRAVDLLARAGLDGCAELHPLRLSGGQRQRLAVALAVAGDPALALLDEPTSAQDRTGAEHVLRLIGGEQDVPRDVPRVTVVATHDPDAFAGIATHRIELSGGRIVSVAELTPGASQ